jgi:alpha-L-fucosidase
MCARSSRPWKVYGEGSSTVEKPEAGQFGGARDVRSKPYMIEDIRFTTRGNALYAYLLAPQPATQAVITSLATNSPHIHERKVQAVYLPTWLRSGIVVSAWPPAFK